MSSRVFLLAIITLVVSMPARAVEVDGREWLQPVDFINLSWLDVAAVCDSDTGACNGMLGAIDVTGYTWANVDDVNALFNSFGVSPPLAGPDAIAEIDSAWAPAFFAAGFISTGCCGTSIIATCRETQGGVFNAIAPTIIDGADGFQDNAETNFGVPDSNPATDIGAWLYRDIPTVVPPAPAPTPVAVPASSAITLLFTALALLAIALRHVIRKRGQATQ
ncbi:hypothetical protein EY643_01490 [Halioglobus maricola]|uniref:IPTL-CTERM sorting domain-containing protein n=1 Tax=Halioglobus maricola TaxID=2601894 RepID=A0A5P9NF80_9GAMM|nr:hypothetical protein [Halioglobus maricola]QFU74431.1 hypothetical protein EY643_01490 [Halioglobus maricola]